MSLDDVKLALSALTGDARVRDHVRAVLSANNTPASSKVLNNRASDLLRSCNTWVLREVGSDVLVRLIEFLCECKPGLVALDAALYAMVQFECITSQQVLLRHGARPDWNKLVSDYDHGILSKTQTIAMGETFRRLEGGAKPKISSQSIATLERDLEDMVDFVEMMTGQKYVVGRALC